jgi:hypothetical protein
MECACTYDKARSEVLDLCGVHSELIRRECELARNAEREACIKIADAWRREMTGGGLAAGRTAAQGIAMEIRARKGAAP